VHRIRPAETPEDWATAAALFREYAGRLGFDLAFQDFERELADLPRAYAPPGGAVLIAEGDLGAAGCVALRPSSPGICEMKRLYVRPSSRGEGIGRALAAAVIGEARARGYRAMRLDTTPAMAEAIALYRSLGFRDIASYRANPIPGALFMELTL
jgi:ribosomal protein S18 acetylase RimI-like enzyme